jgi:site-specific DNA recombinase
MFYKCRKHRIASDDIEEIYYQHLKSFLLTDQQLETFLTKADSTIQSKEKELKKLLQDSKRIEEEMDKIMKLHLSGQIPTDGFNKYYKPLDEQLKQIEYSIPEIQGEIDFLKIECVNGNQLMHDAKNLYDRWPQLKFDSKRQIVEEITSIIVISNDEIKIKFNYTPSLSLNTPDSQRNFKDSSMQ